MAKRTREHTDGGPCTSSSSNRGHHGQQPAASQLSADGHGSDPKRPRSGNQGVERTPSIPASPTQVGWLRELWLGGVGYEELLWGWYPFVQDDFTADDDVDQDAYDDDIWHIKNIHQIPCSIRTNL